MARTRGETAALIRPVIVLACVCVVAGALLGAVHASTEPLIEANERNRAQLVYEELVSGATSFEEVPCEAPGCESALVARDASGSALATIIVAEAKGYGGDLPVAVAFGTDGHVVGIHVMGNDETPGLGTRVAESAYIDQYVGRGAETLEAADVDLISGATISSKAALAAFNRAVEAYQEVS